MTAYQPSFSPSKQGRHFSRSLFIHLLEASLDCAEFRFARNIALQWLSVYPGDLAVSLLYAKSLTGEKRWNEVRTILKGLCQVDPESVSALQLWKVAETNYLLGVADGADRKKAGLTPGPALETIDNWLAALDPQDSPVYKAGFRDGSLPAGWGDALASIRKSLYDGEIAKAEERLPGLLSETIDSPLVALTHLQILQANPDAPLAAGRSLAEYYHRRWPDCLACTLLLANWLMQEGATDRAVALLHQVAARDVSGDIAARVLGIDHPYRNLWPDHLSVNLDVALPGSVVAALGWNRLPAGEPREQARAATIPVEALVAAAMETDNLVDKRPPASEAMAEMVMPVTANREDIVRLSKELDDLAAQMDQLPPSQYDGRYPVYVIFSVHKNLVTSYGKEAADNLVNEMKALAQAVSQNPVAPSRSRWAATVFLPDLPASAAAFRLEPTAATDPWKLKLALVDLDKALGKKGQMIGALLIVGGPEIVPFHNLPNPVDDPDTEVPSDNPYTTRDENYFIPEWPAGRLPGEAGGNPVLLLQNLRAVTQRYHNHPKSFSPPARWFAWITGWFKPNRKPIRRGFGYSAAVWRQASFQVFRPVGEARSVLVSPPYMSNGHSTNGAKKGLLPAARLGYFNLHGLADSAEWYGQRHPDDPKNGPDYPVAVRPQDIQDLGARIPTVVFSEACYGGLINQKTAEQALALQFLRAGSHVVAGSTAMSYGAISAPLIAADLLGYVFWKGLLEGYPAGEALQRAKIRLASEMHQRQGYLDGEDQKTLISFVLYGDPLARLDGNLRNAKHLRRLSGTPPTVKTVCDRILEEDASDQIPGEVLNYVKQVVASYLPGMSDAHVTYTAERAVCIAHGHACPTAQLNGKNRLKQEPNRRVVVMNKTIESAGSHHPHYARLTLDQEGKLVKIVVSR
jgi:hypothetical protein